MAKNKSNKYIISLQETELKDGTQPSNSIEFPFENHDNIMHLIEQIKDSDKFADKSDNVPFVVGLK